MKLAEALIRRSDIQKRIEQLRARLVMNALVQEGDQPAENPQELLAELRRLLGRSTKNRVAACAMGVATAGVPIIGTSVDTIEAAEDREKFQQTLLRLRLKQPANGIARTMRRPPQAGATAWRWWAAR